jgi:hypothetical protein
MNGQSGSLFVIARPCWALPPSYGLAGSVAFRRLARRDFTGSGGSGYQLAMERVHRRV